MNPLTNPDFIALCRKVTFALEIPDDALMAFGNFFWNIFGPTALVFEEALNTVVFPGSVDALNKLYGEYMMPVRKPLPLMSRPVDCIYAVVLYLLSLLVLYAFSQLVGKHSYRFLGLIHNLFLFVLSLYMGVAIFFCAVASEFPRVWNNPIVDSANDDTAWCLVKLSWVFLISKLPEFGDTFLMVLKQNYRQITFLHLYHHGSILWWTYIILSCGPGGDIYWASMCNSLVHVVMYGYYGGTLAFSDGPIRRFFNKIKFHITKIQLLQFVLNIGQALYVFVQPAGQALFPRYLCAGQTLYMISMVVLFANFLLRNQGKSGKGKKHADKKKEE